MAIADRMIYLVLASYGAGIYAPERDLADMDRATTVQHIAEGQFTDLANVIELNPVEGTSRDVTEDFARDVMSRWANDGEGLSPWQADFVERFVSVQAANSFRRVA